MLAPVDPRRDRLVGALMELFLAEGFLHFSVEDLAARLSCSKSTVYVIAASKEQILATVVRAFFRRATERVEARAAGAGSPRERIGSYLAAIAAELQPASPAFFADLERFAPARASYRINTQRAADRVRALVAESMPASGGAPLNAHFVGVVAGRMMELIQRGVIGAETGLDDAAAYRALADLIAGGLPDR